MTEEQVQAFLKQCFLKHQGKLRSLTVLALDSVTISGTRFPPISSRLTHILRLRTVDSTARPSKQVMLSSTEV